MANWMGESSDKTEAKCTSPERGSLQWLMNKNLNLRSKPHVGCKKKSHVNKGVKFLNLLNTGSLPESL